MVRSLLHAVPKASQLHLIEYNSPHLHPDSEEVWEQRCSTDFVRIRIQVEDRTMLKPESWRALYIQNELATAVKFIPTLEFIHPIFKFILMGVIGEARESTK